MKNYVKPVMDVTSFEENDIVTLSVSPLGGNWLKAKEFGEFGDWDEMPGAGV